MGSDVHQVMEIPECFICRDTELHDKDPLRKFCNCKNLLSHHTCLSTWIQTGHDIEDRLRCIICESQYHLQWSSPWRSIGLQWQTWLVVTTVLVLLALVPYAVHCMLTAFTRPPPPSSFNVAAACFGLLTEILLIKCLWSYLSRQYRRAEHSSFTVRPRTSEEDGAQRSHWDRFSATSAPAGHDPSVTSVGHMDAKKEDVVTDECLCLF